MALPEKSKKQLTGLVAFLGLAGAGLFWFYWHQPQAAQINQMQLRIDSLTVQVDSARENLARGSVEALRQRVQTYQGAVQLMRRLVPEASEVPSLIDNIASRAKRRGVNVSTFTPGAVDEGTPYQTHRYRITVIGHFDQIGGLLADIGSLPRIMVAYGLRIGPAGGPAVKAFADTTGALLEAAFSLRTYVKQPAAVEYSATSGGSE